jgi:putative flippase GtrA
MNMVQRLVAAVIALLPQLGKFGVVGVVGLFVDVGGFNLLRYAGGEGPLHDYPLTAKIVSAAVATVVSWLGHRFWTFRHGRREAVHHEFALFILMCTIGTGLAVSCLAVSHYLLGFDSVFADNVAANVVGLGLGTGFRFWAYRTVVFSGNRCEDVESADPVSVRA